MQIAPATVGNANVSVASDTEPSGMSDSSEMLRLSSGRGRIRAWQRGRMESLQAEAAEANSIIKYQIRYY